MCGRGSGVHDPVLYDWDRPRSWFQKSNALGVSRNHAPRVVSGQILSRATHMKDSPATHHVGGLHLNAMSHKSASKADHLPSNRPANSASDTGLGRLKGAVHSPIDDVEHRQHHRQYHCQLPRIARSQAKDIDARLIDRQLRGGGKHRQNSCGLSWQHAVQRTRRPICYPTVIRIRRHTVSHSSHRAWQRLALPAQHNSWRFVMKAAVQAVGWKAWRHTDSTGWIGVRHNACLQVW